MPGYRDTCFACGKVLRSAIAEAKHRHNFPVMCTRNKRFAEFMAKHHGTKEES